MRRGAVLACLLGLDLTLTCAVWSSARSAMVRPADLPPAAPLVIFYSSEASDRAGRIAAAMYAYAHHGRRPLVIVGGSRPARNWFGSEEMARELVEKGITADIATERQSHDTLGNVNAALRLTNGAHTLVLVSDAIHLIRIRWLLERLRPDLRLISYPVEFVPGPVSAWWQVHYEAVAWLSMLLPDGLRRAMLRAARP